MLILTESIAIDRSAIADFCKRWHVLELALFGSVVRDDFGPDSDIDVLVSLDRSARHTLLDMHEMEEELRSLFGRNVDLVSRRGVENSRNSLRRRRILDSAHVIYR